jgi:hypothetical protein
MRRFFRNLRQHWFNPLHVYCRLKDCGLPVASAQRVSGIWERWVYKRPRVALVIIAMVLVLVSCSLVQAKHVLPIDGTMGAAVPVGGGDGR